MYGIQPNDPRPLADQLETIMDHIDDAYGRDTSIARYAQHLAHNGGEPADLHEWEPGATCPICGNVVIPDPARDFLARCSATYPVPDRLLFGHTNPDTAFVVDDYPYGFRLRTTIRYWMETKRGHGQRFVSQTMNPKTGRWNKPKASTYVELGWMYLDAEDHVKWGGMQVWPTECRMQVVERMLGDNITEFQRDQINQWRLWAQASKYVKHEVRVMQPGDSRQSVDETTAVWGAALGQAARDLGV